MRIFRSPIRTTLLACSSFRRSTTLFPVNQPRRCRAPSMTVLPLSPISISFWSTAGTSVTAVLPATRTTSRATSIPCSTTSRATRRWVRRCFPSICSRSRRCPVSTVLNLNGTWELHIQDFLPVRRRRRYFDQLGSVRNTRRYDAVQHHGAAGVQCRHRPGDRGGRWWCPTSVRSATSTSACKLSAQDRLSEPATLMLMLSGMIGLWVGFFRNS